MKYDLIVIGAGPGGYVAAIRAAQLGKKVALIEKDRVGGTCLNRGCIPTKALMHAGEILEEITSASELGINVGEVHVDFAKLHERKAEVVEQLVSGVENLVKANEIDFYQGEAVVTGPHTVSVKSGEAQGEAEGSLPGEGCALGEAIELEADYIVLATGSSPAIPPISGFDLDGVITSDDVLIGAGVETDSIVIIGGGVIGVELAGLYNSLGTKVTIVEAMARILPTMDREISQNTSMILKKRGIEINTGAMVKSVEAGEAGELKVTFTVKEEDKTVSASNVLVAIGRRPQTAGVIDEAGPAIEMDRGFVLTDEFGKTNVDSVYAIGDIVAGGIQLAHAASAEGVRAVEHMFSKGAGRDEAGDICTKDISWIPAGIYTDPEIASVGITEAEAKEQGISYMVGKAMTGANGKTLIESGERGYVKLIFAYEGDAEDPSSAAAHEQKLIGAQIVSKRATDMIGGLTIAVNSGATLKDLEKVIWPHPTFSEVIGEAIEDALGGAIHSMPRKKKR